MNKIRNIVFINDQKISFIIVNNNDINKVLFYQTAKINLDNLSTMNNNDLKSKIEPILTLIIKNAQSFTGMVIRSIEIVFDDANISLLSYKNKIFDNCKDIDDIYKNIYREISTKRSYVVDINLRKHNQNYEKMMFVTDIDILIMQHQRLEKFLPIFDNMKINVFNIIPLSILLGDQRKNEQLIIRLNNNNLKINKYIYGILEKSIQVPLENEQSSSVFSLKDNCYIDQLIVNINKLNNIHRYDTLSKSIIGLVLNEKYRQIDKICYTDLCHQYSKKIFIYIKHILDQYPEFYNITNKTLIIDQLNNIIINNNDNSFSLNINCDPLIYNNQIKIALNNLFNNLDRKISHYQFENMNIEELINTYENANNLVFQQHNEYRGERYE